MLSVFPELLFLSPLAATLIRGALVIFFGYAAWKHSLNADLSLRALGLGEAAVMFALFFGAWTQPAAVAGAVLLLGWFFLQTRPYTISSILLALVMCLSLLVLGPGPFAFDLPL